MNAVHAVAPLAAVFFTLVSTWLLTWTVLMALLCLRRRPIHTPLTLLDSLETTL